MRILYCGQASKFKQERMNMDILRKKIVIIPINDQLHWRLLVVVNPYLCIPNYEHNDDDPSFQPYSCMIHLDPMGSPNVGVTETLQLTVINWLNSLYGEDIFSRDNMKIYCPKVPRQQNLFDCGLYVLQYIRGFIYTIYHTFTVEDANNNFASKVTNGASFKFDQSYINQMREDMDQLIPILSSFASNTKVKEFDSSSEKISDRTVSEKKGGILVKKKKQKL